MANLTGRTKTIKKNDKTAHKGPKEKTNPYPTNTKETAKKDPQVTIDAFSEVFLKVQKAFKTKFLKTGPLPKSEA